MGVWVSKSVWVFLVHNENALLIQHIKNQCTKVLREYFFNSLEVFVLFVRLRGTTGVWLCVAQLAGCVHWVDWLTGNVSVQSLVMGNSLVVRDESLAIVVFRLAGVLISVDRFSFIHSFPWLIC